MSIRILYLCPGRSFHVERLGRKLAGVAQCWRDAGHDVKHICGGDIYNGGISDGGGYGYQKTHTRWYRKAPGMAPLVTSMSEWRDLRHDSQMLEHLTRVCGNWWPDVIWDRSCRLHCAGLTFARQIDVPYVLEWKDHLVDYGYSLFKRRALQMEAKKNRQADHIVVESGVLRDELGREGVDTGKIIVAHNAVQADQFFPDPQKRAKVRTDLGVKDDMVLAGYLGSYAFYHDTARLVLAADIIRRRGAKIKILMVGAGREYLGSRKLAEELGLLDHMLIMKPGVSKDQVPGILAALDIAVLPGSTDIICPIKIQEYMACELPSVLPDYACNREVIESGQTGVLFTPENAQDLAQKICTLAEDSQARLRIGQAARQKVLRRFSWESTWGAALESVLSRSDIRKQSC